MPSTIHFASPTGPDYWEQACAELSARCPVMAGIIASYAGEATLTSRGDAFYTLLRSIVGQQISVKAADAVWARLIAALGPKATPKALLKLSEEQLRACGLSGAKVRYSRAIAQHFVDNPGIEETWRSLPEEDSIKAMVQITGVGKWTAEMMLIFHQMRPNVFPLGDLGLINALNKHYNKGKPLTPTQLKRLEKKFSPWRTVATWYLWRSLDPVAVEY